MDLLEASDRFGHRQGHFPGVEPDSASESDLRCQQPSRKLEFVRSAEEITAAITERTDCCTVTNSAVHAAAVAGNTDVLQLLLRHGQGDKLRDSIAAGYGSHESIRSYMMGRRCRLAQGSPKLLRQQYGEVEDYSTDDGDYAPQSYYWRLFTPLQAALYARQDGCALVLAEHGAELEFGPGPQGQTDHALHAAAREGCSSALEYLCNRADINVNALDVDGYTPLAHAIISPHPADDSVSILVRHGADPNTKLLAQGQHDDNFTHLHLACWNGQWRRAIQLLDAGADVSRVYTPVHFHEWHEHPPSYRPIDLVCSDHQLAYLDHPDKNGVRLERGEVVDRQRLLIMMIRDHGLDVATATNGERGDHAMDSPMVMAVKHRTHSLELLSAMRDAGVTFEGHSELLQHVVESMHFMFLRDADQRPKLVMQMLLDCGVRVRSAIEKQGMFHAILGMFHSALISAWQVRDIDQTAGVLEMLFNRGGMDPNFRGTVAWYRVDERDPDKRPMQNCSLFRAFLLLEQGELSVKRRRLFEALLVCGAEPPELVDVVRDLIAWFLNTRGDATSPALVCVISLVGKYLVLPSAEEFRDELFGTPINEGGGREGHLCPGSPVDRARFVEMILGLFNKLEIECASPGYLEKAEEFFVLVRQHRQFFSGLIAGKS